MNIKVLVAGLSAIAFLWMPGCTKIPAPVPAVKACVVFLSGDVKLIRNDNSVVPTVGSPVDEGDKVVTGSNSLVVIQVADSNVIRVSQDSTMEMKILSLDSQVKLYVAKGTVASKVTRLEKGNSFSVQTPTAVAAVRGTEFGVTVQDGKDKISVLSGKVAVGGVSGKPAAEETIATEGSTVVVETKGTAAPVVTTRPIEAEETAQIKKVSDIKLIPDISTVKPAELEKQKEEILKTESAPAAEAAPAVPVTPAAAKAVKEEKIRKLIASKPTNIEQIKEVFDRIDEVSLYSGQTIQGAIITRGATYSILTTNGVVNVAEDKVRTVKVLK